MIGLEMLPASWELVPIDGVVEINPRSFCVIDGNDSLPVHFVPMSAVTEEFGGIDVTGRRPLAEVKKGYTSFLAGDVIFAKITPCMENGKVAVVPALPDHVAFGSTEFHVLRCSDAIAPKWLAWFLSQAEFRKIARQNMTGSAGQMRVPTAWLSTAEIPVPPLPEQARILEKLEELLSDLDAGIAELKAAQKKLDLYRQSLLKSAVEGALTAAWRERRQAERAQYGEPIETGGQLLARILTERRARWEAGQLAALERQGKSPPKDWQKKYPEPIEPDTSALAALPEGWVWAAIDQLARVGTGVTPLRARVDYFVGGTIPWITSGALNSETVNEASEFVTEQALRECRLEIYPAGSLLIAMYGEGRTRGKCSELLIDATINQAVAALVPSPAASRCKGYLKAFLLHSYEAMREQASGGVQPNLNLQIIKSISLPLPPLDEQTEIMRLLDAQFEQIRQLQRAIGFGLRQAAAQRRNILKAAFSGQLVPQDPNDEPASVLLERIRAERTARATTRTRRGRMAPSPRSGSRVGSLALHATTEVPAGFMTEADRPQGEHAYDPFGDVAP